MSFRILAPIVVVVLISECVVAQMTPVSQARSLTAVVLASVDDLDDTNADDFDAASFLPINEEANAKAFVTVPQLPDDLTAHASALARQNSILGSALIVASGEVGSSSSTDGMGTFAESDAGTFFDYSFELAPQHGVRIVGSMETFDFGQASVMLRGPSGIILNAFAQGQGAFDDFDEAAFDGPGLYTLSAMAFGDSQAGGIGGIDGQSAMFQFTVTTLDDCNGNGVDDAEELFPDLYAVTEDGPQLLVNRNYEAPFVWETVGQLDGGVQQCRGFTRDPLSGDLYAIAVIANLAHLIVVDPAFAAVTDLGTITSVPLDFDGPLALAFRDDGELFVVYDSLFHSFSSLAPLDIGTVTVGPVVTNVALSPGTNRHALTFVPGSADVLHGTSQLLERINSNTGQITPVFGGQWEALGSDETSGRIVGSDSFGVLYEIDLAMNDAPPISGAALPIVASGFAFTPSAVDGDGDGEIDACNGGVLGDMNCDGLVSVSDIGPFVLALTDPAGYATQFPDCDPLNGDTNGDELLSVGDIGGFVGLLAP